jgi:periplasmic divalent cation tolerance protein
MQTVHIALCTIDSAENAQALARALLERRCIACANIVSGVESMYWWEGKIERAAEVLLVFKTTADRVKELKAAVAELHPYDTPELLVVPVTAGLEQYLAWVEKETRR